ncbi:MAG: baseplate J/gp47 family protein [Paraclostridium sp.]
MIERKGYSVVSEEDYYNDIMKELKAKFPTMSENPANLLCVFARMFARNENARDYDRVKSYSNAYVATATDMALNKAVRTAGIDRLEGTRAIGKVRITKDSNVTQLIIPGSMKMKAGNIEYEITKDTATIVNTDFVELEIISVYVGELTNIANGSKLKPVLNVNGLKEVVAIEDIKGGTNTESDLHLRDRYFQRMNSFANSSLRGIIDSVKTAPDVYNVDGDENNTDSTVGGLLPHSFIIYVAGGTDQDIAEKIMTSKPAGVQTNGKVSVTVRISDRDHEIRFSRFTDQEVYYKVEVVIDRTTAPPNIVDVVKEKLVEYTRKHNTIVSYEVSNFISQEIESIKGVKSILFGNSPNPTTNTDLVAPSGFNLITDLSKIEVKVV